MRPPTSSARRDTYKAMRSATTRAMRSRPSARPPLWTSFLSTMHPQVGSQPVDTFASACPPRELPLERRNSRSQLDVLGRGIEPSAAQIEGKYHQTDDDHDCQVATPAACRVMDRQPVACDPALRPLRRMRAGIPWNRLLRPLPDHPGHRDWDGSSQGNAGGGDARLQCRCPARKHRMSAREPLPACGRIQSYAIPLSPLRCATLRPRSVFPGNAGLAACARAPVFARARRGRSCCQQTRSPREVPSALRAAYAYLAAALQDLSHIDPDLCVTAMHAHGVAPRRREMVTNERQRHSDWLAAISGEIAATVAQAQ